MRSCILFVCGADFSPFLRGVVCATKPAPVKTEENTEVLSTYGLLRHANLMLKQPTCAGLSCKTEVADRMGTWFFIALVLFVACVSSISPADEGLPEARESAREPNAA